VDSRCSADSSSSEQQVFGGQQFSEKQVFSGQQFSEQQVFSGQQFSEQQVLSGQQFQSVPHSSTAYKLISFFPIKTVTKKKMF